MINPPREHVVIATPTKDRRIDVGYMQGLFQVQDYFERPLILQGMSDIGLARNNLAHEFVENTIYEWIVWIDSDINFLRSDWELLWEGEEDIVCAEYSKKNLGEPPAEFGMGFVRIHRDVFERIKAHLRDDGTEYAQRFYSKGAMRINYFPTGCTTDHRWIGEDRGFYLMAAMVGATMRVEKRTKLKHIGEFEFQYPDQIPHWGPRMPSDSEEGAN